VVLSCLAAVPSVGRRGAYLAHAAAVAVLVVVSWRYLPVGGKYTDDDEVEALAAAPSHEHWGRKSFGFAPTRPAAVTAAAAADKAAAEGKVVIEAWAGETETEAAAAVTNSPARHRRQQQEEQQGEQHQHQHQQAAPAGPGDGRMHRNDSAFCEVGHFRLTP